MAPHENEALNNLIDAVNEMSTKLTVIQTKLFGDNDTENDQGRIPRLEAQGRSHERRIRRIERAFTMVAGVVALCGIVGAVAAFAYHIKTIMGF